MNKKKKFEIKKPQKESARRHNTSEGEGKVEPEGQCLDRKGEQSLRAWEVTLVRSCPGPTPSTPARRVTGKKQCGINWWDFFFFFICTVIYRSGCPFLLDTLHLDDEMPPHTQTCSTRIPKWKSSEDASGHSGKVQSHVGTRRMNGDIPVHLIEIKTAFSQGI